MNARSSWTRRIGVAAVCGLALSLTPSLSVASSAESAAVLDDPTHELVLKDGRVLQVLVVDETEDDYVVEVVLSGIKAQRTFSKDDVLTMDARSADELSGDDAGFDVDHRVYVADIEGNFGSDITATSLRRIMQDASRNDANVVILKLHTDWQVFEGILQELDDDVASFDQFWAAERMMPVLTVETKDTKRWDEQPRIIYWVHRAMSGMAFMPMTTKDVFFTPEGKMGAIGNLDQIFENEEAAFAKKQQGLRRTAVEGWLIETGHDARIGNAMMQSTYVLSYRVRRGEVEFLEGYPDSDPGGGWILLTDDGEGDNEDTDAQIVRGLANDTLTMYADVAEKIGFSKGIAESPEDILVSLGMSESSRIIGDRDGDGFTDSAGRTLDGWITGYRETARRYLELERDFAEVNGPNALGRRIALLRRMIALITPYREVLDPAGGLMQSLNLRMEQLRNQQRLISAQERRRGVSPQRQGNGPREGNGPG